MKAQKEEFPPETPLKRIACTAVSFTILSMLPALIGLVITGSGGGKAISSTVESLFSSTTLMLELAYFLLAVFSLHIIGALLFFFLAGPLLSRLVQQHATRPAIVLFTLMLGFWLLLTNTVQFPDSLVAFKTYSAVGDTLIRYAWLGLSATLLIACTLGLLIRITSAIKPVHRKRGILSTLAVLITAVSLTGISTFVTGKTSGIDQLRSHPDVILIGLDSVRIDHIGYFNGLEHSLTPTLDQLLQNAVVVRDAWTPLARTFPSWVSILTGQYPSTHGAQFNLTNSGQVDFENNLAHQLAERGYLRLYGIDETRFSNLDASYGFDEIHTPAIGASDFLIGKIADVPMVNVVANTWLGSVLFPNVHMNRAIATTYKPETMDGALRKAITSADPERPLFLTVHYELPHWPYTWAESDAYIFDPPPALDSLSHPNYQATVSRADHQVADLIETLEHAGRLENAILVLLSDHGEAFTSSEPGWRRQGNEGAGGRLPIHGGHGTNIVSEAQYRVILGFQGFGTMAGLQPRLIREATTSLIDIRPTLQDWLGIPLPADGVEIDGISLLGLLKDDNSTGLQERAVTLETGFSLPSIEAGAPDPDALAREGAKFYDVTLDGRLAIKDEWLPFLLRKKQRGAVSGHWILSAIPNDAIEHAWHLWLVNIDTEEYWDARAAASLPQGAPMKMLLDEVCTRFENDPDFQLPECHSSSQTGTYSAALID